MKKKKNFLIFYVFLLFVLLNCFSILYAQKKNKKQLEEPSSCEYVRTILDIAIIDTKKLNDKSFLILVVRMGKNENSKKLLKNRLETLKQFTKSKSQYFANYIIVTGAKADTLGKVEIYIKGKLWESIFIENGKNLGDNCMN